MACCRRGFALKIICTFATCFARHCVLEIDWIFPENPTQKRLVAKRDAFLKINFGEKGGMIV
jgi:hypothetical protein